MKIVINLCLIWVVMSSAVFTQMPDSKPQATKFDEFGNINSGEIKARLDAFFIELANVSTTQGFIINYGSDKEIALRERLIRQPIVFRRYDGLRITFVKGVYRNEIKTQFWLVPIGAENPKLEPTAIKFDELGIIQPTELKRRIKKLRAKLEKNDSKDLSQIYIVNYGNDKNVSVRENAVKKHLYEDCRDCFGLGGLRITFVRGGKNGILKTIIWIIPPDAEIPKF
jgi:hypothetical protein